MAARCARWHASILALIAIGVSACGGSDGAPVQPDASVSPSGDAGLDATTRDEGVFPLDASLETSADTGAPDGGACAPFAPDPGLAAMRASCAFAAGEKVEQTLDSAAAARAAIKHLIIVVHENRSFDHMYGTLGSGYEGFPASYSNPTPDGGIAFPTHAPTACPPDICHSVSCITAEYDDGGMNGFYRKDGAESLWYYEPTDHPFYSWLFGTFAGSDQYFCSTLGPTGDNRRFLYGASATQTTVNVFTEMNAASVKWADYYQSAPPLYNTYSWPVGYPNTYPYSQFLSDLDSSKLPPVTYVDSPSDEHPPGSMKDGEVVMAEILSHAFQSPLWNGLAIVFTYDEGGGFFDHVAPPPACAPSSSAGDQAYKVLGIRVPLVVISPYARKGYVSHVPHSHTSVLRLVELLNDLPAITARDANSDALLDMFDFACPDFARPPTLPATPTGGCP